MNEARRPDNQHPAGESAEEPAPDAVAEPAPDAVAEPTGERPGASEEDAAGAPEEAAGAPAASADLVVAFVPGVMPGKWFFRWRDRHPGRVLAERPLEAERWREELEEGRAHACLVRLPAHPRPEVDDLTALRREFRAVELYAEQQVVVLPRDHELTLLDEVPVAELVDEVLLQESRTLPERHRLRSPEDVAGDPPLPGVRHVRDTIELVAAGLGLVVVPMSLARLHRRKDLVHRVVPDAATVPVALVWPQDLPEDREELVQDFVGVARGRGLNSSRGGRAPAAAPARTPSSSRQAGGTPQAPRHGGGRGPQGGTRSGGSKSGGSRSGGSRSGGTGRGGARSGGVKGGRRAGGRGRR
ncbi:LysR family transcriptional regulator substrate-binding protein [Kocuria sp. M1R5S2]|uniref:LysR family transcriptional regulator substrate-binding protein n=1 Tax=Kocuria rhizosphaerae TaxID=3376285 RepID=UPI0037A9A453